MFAGYEAGDHKLIVKAKYLRPGEFRGPEISLSSKAYTPDLFISSYMGNHYQWKNVFSKQIEQKVGLSWDLKKLNLFF